MAEQRNNQQLNQLLINICRSLLQYVGESWPWTGYGHESERETLDKLVKRQERDILQLTDFIADRGWPVNFGSYPTEYTDLHYVALDYLLYQLIENQEALLDDIDHVIRDCSDDAPAVKLLQQIRSEEQQILQGIRELTRPEAAGSTS